MAEVGDIEVVAFDVLGTLVDEPSGLRAAIRDAVPEAGDASVEDLLTSWQQYIEVEQQRIWQGQRPQGKSVCDIGVHQHRDPGRGGRSTGGRPGRSLRPGDHLPAGHGGAAPAALGRPRRRSRAARAVIPPYSGSPTRATPLCCDSTHMPGCAGTRRCPARPCAPISRRRRSASSPSTPLDVHRCECS